MVDELFGFLGDSEAFELQRELQEVLSEYEPTFVMTRVESDSPFESEEVELDGKGEHVYQFITHQNGNRYGFEVAFNKYITEPCMFIDQVERCIRSVEEVVVEDAGYSVDLMDERDSPYFLDDECTVCGTTLVRSDETPDEDYQTWVCPNDGCTAGRDGDGWIIDSHTNWDEWV